MKNMKYLILSLMMIIGLAFPVQALEPGLVNVTEIDESPAAWSYKLIFPNGSLTDNADGTVTLDLSGSYDTAGSAAGAAAASIPRATIEAEGDIILGTGPGTFVRLPKGPPNSILGVNNADVLGYNQFITPVLTSAPASDDTYTGTIATMTAGENLAQWDVVYCKNKAGVHACYKYDADGADKALPPRGVATAAITADAAGVILVEGIVRNDGWAQTTNQDEGKKVYASTTAGGITLTEPATDGVEIGFVVEQNVIYFKFNNLGANTGSGAPVKATSPSIVSPSFTTSAALPANGTVDAAGEITVDTTTDQLRYYGGAARSIPYIQYSSFVIAGPIATDDINLMKAPYGMTILGISCIVQGTTSVTGQLQECSATGTDCADLDADIVCDADGAADDGSFTDPTIASGAWIRWKTTSISDTPTFLSVTFKYSVVAD